MTETVKRSHNIRKGPTISKSVSGLKKKDETPKDINDWIRKDSAGNSDMTRLTIFLPKLLHKKIKVQCAQEETKMNHVILKLLEEHFKP